MASITVRVTPRSGRTEVEAGADGVVIRVRAAPEAGKATEEAARALADALGVPPTRVRLRPLLARQLFRAQLLSSHLRNQMVGASIPA